MNRILLISLLLFSAATASAQEGESPNPRDPEQYDRDYEACLAKAESETSSMSDVEKDEKMQSIYNGCMRELGYREETGFDDSSSSGGESSGNDADLAPQSESEGNEPSPELIESEQSREHEETPLRPEDKATPTPAEQQELNSQGEPTAGTVPEGSATPAPAARGVTPSAN